MRLRKPTLRILSEMICGNEPYLHFPYRSSFIQDIFDLIYCARIVIVDFTGRNPNVMYETGIAHTLGKEVIPICQNFEDIPSDLTHHRALKYLPNDEGYRTLFNELFKRIKAIIERA